eukprot:2842567-Prymnesium_polylepis.1
MELVTSERAMACGVDDVRSGGALRAWWSAEAASARTDSLCGGPASCALGRRQYSSEARFFGQGGALGS